MNLITRSAAFDDPSALLTTITAFFSADIRGDRSKQNRAQVFLLSHIVGPFLGLSVPLAFYILDPTPQADLIVLSASILAFWAFPFLMRLGLSYPWLVRLSILNLNFSIYWSCYFYGGASSPTLVWVLIIPILTVFYIGGDNRLRSELIAISVAGAVIFTSAYFALGPDGNDISATAMTTLSASSLVAVMCYVAFMAIYYARIFDAGVDLEQEVVRRRLMSIELKRSVDAANQASTAKSEFLARMSHELRSPLNAILGYGNLLLEELDEAGDAISRRDLQRITEAGTYLSNLIDKILSLAKIEAGKLKVNAGICDLRKCLDTIAGSYAEQAAARGNSLSVQVDPGVAEVRTDRAKITQIAEILIQNAVQYTKDGRIDVSALPAGGDAPEAFEIVVQDTGCGIPDQIVTQIFETFLVEREAADGRYGGTGLSLSLARKLCDLMEGELTVESVEGAGSTFRVRMPQIAP